MSQPQILLHFSPGGQVLPSPVQEFAVVKGLEVLPLDTIHDVFLRVSRAYPAAIVVDGRAPANVAFDLCRLAKEDTFTAVVPVIAYLDDGEEGAVAAAFEVGADEVLTPRMSPRETRLRLDLALRRAERDVSVHPTTRLPGTVQIERDFSERLRSGETFAVCYADLDHFKEFNDRYGYNHGDRVILVVSRILRDVVRAHSPGAFVGHIGGDDFIFTVPFAHLRPCCEDVIAVFDELIPLQYSEDDRERGSFIGKDRRGEEYEVPLMTVSIGVVTNEHRVLQHTAEISELATEMKTYAKTFAGSLYVVDRRGTGKDDENETAA